VLAGALHGVFFAVQVRIRLLQRLALLLELAAPARIPGAALGHGALGGGPVRCVLLDSARIPLHLRLRDDSLVGVILQAVRLQQRYLRQIGGVGWVPLHSGRVSCGPLRDLQQHRPLPPERRALRAVLLLRPGHVRLDVLQRLALLVQAQRVQQPQGVVGVVLRSRAALGLLLGQPRGGLPHSQLLHRVLGARQQ